MFIPFLLAFFSLGLAAIGRRRMGMAVWGIALMVYIGICLRIY